MAQVPYILSARLNGTIYVPVPASWLNFDHNNTHFSGHKTRGWSKKALNLTAHIGTDLLYNAEVFKAKSSDYLLMGIPVTFISEILGVLGFKHIIKNISYVYNKLILYISENKLYDVVRVVIISKNKTIDVYCSDETEWMLMKMHFS